MKQSTTLHDYIKVYKILTPELCQNIIDRAVDWDAKTWISAYGKDKNNIHTGVSSANVDALLESKILMNVHKGLSIYSHEVGPKKNGQPVKLASDNYRCIINRYNAGIGLENHFDQNGSYNPSITCITMLNDKFQGGNLIFFDDYVVPLNVGEAVYFPSNFMFTHKVTTVTDGIRYTLSVWLQ